MIFVSGDIDATFDTPEETTIFTLLCSFDADRAKFGYVAWPPSEHTELSVLLTMASDYLNLERAK